MELAVISRDYSGSFFVNNRVIMGEGDADMTSHCAAESCSPLNASNYCLYVLFLLWTQECRRGGIWSFLHKWKSLHYCTCKARVKWCNRLKQMNCRLLIRLLRLLELVFHSSGKDFCPRLRCGKWAHITYKFNLASPWQPELMSWLTPILQQETQAVRDERERKKRKEGTEHLTLTLMACRDASARARNW